MSLVASMNVEPVRETARTDPPQGEIGPEALFDVLWLLSERSYRTGLLDLSEHLEDAMDLLLREWARMERNPARAAVSPPPSLPPLGGQRRRGTRRAEPAAPSAMPTSRALRRAARRRLLMR